MVAKEAIKLLQAARDGDLTTLINSEDSSVSESSQDEQGATCLHYAARGGHTDVIEHLINIRRFSPTRRSNVGATALHDAAATGNLEVLKWLLNLSDTKVDDQDGTGAAVTHLAARYGHTQTLEWLLDNTNCDVLKKSASGALPLHFAAEGGHVECVKLLVAESPRSVNMQMNNGSTPVYMACQSGHLMVAEYLASKNGTPKIHSFDGMSPLHAAAQMGHLRVIMWLIQEQGLNPNERDFDGATPLHYAASRGHDDVVDWMLREGNARIILDNLGGSPLHTAAQFGDHKLNPPRVTQYINSQKHLRTRIVKTLLNHGCSPDITDNDGLTAEDLADKCGNETAAAVLRGETVIQEVQQPAFAVKAAVSSQLSSSPSWSGQPNHEVSAPSPAPPRPAPVSQAPTFSGPPPLSSSVKRAPPRTAPKPPSPFLHDRQTSAKVSGIVSVQADIHHSADRASISSSQETGEREFAPEPSTHNSLSKFTPEDLSKASASVVFYLSEPSAQPQRTSLPPLSPAYASIVQQQPASQPSRSRSHSNHSGEQPAQESERGWSANVQRSQKRDPSPSIAERKALLETAAARQKAAATCSSSREFVARFSTMEGVNGGGGGDASNDNMSVSSTSSTSSSGAAKSVIQISSKNVTIISTGKDSGAPARVTTTPLRNSDRDASLSGSHVANRKKDTDFISSLSQKFQPSGAAVRPTPIASSRGGSTSSSYSASSQRNGKDSTDGFSQQQQKAAASLVASSAGMMAGHRRQQDADTASPPPPTPPVVNGHAEEGAGTSVAETNGQNGGAGPGDMAPPPPPPPPPPPAVSRSLSEQPAPVVRKADASYTPRPTSYTGQSSSNGSMPGTPRGQGDVKNDLMAALTAVVTSGSPAASLRKTRGPGKGAINEVYSKKTPGAATSNGPSSSLPTIDEFDPKNFLDKVPDTDSTGNKVPDWKRQMMAKNLATKAHQEYLEQKKIDDYEARFKNMPAWKRALIEKKEGK